jgi:hypothetical protein
MHWIDPESLPETKGTVTRLLLDPHGDADGLILDGHLQVHLPPHLSSTLVERVAPGDVVSVRGVKPRDVNMVSAVSIVTAHGDVVIDDGPHAGEKKRRKPAADVDEGDSGPARRAQKVSGAVVLSLHGPKGELRGALLDDGTSLRMSRESAAELASHLMPGACVEAWGELVETGIGRTLDVDEIAHAAGAETDA